MKLDRAIEKLNNAMVEMKEIAHVLDISVNPRTGISIHLKSMRDMEQVPGEIAFFQTGLSEPYHPIRAEKVYAGARFFCYLKTDEYQNVLISQGAA